MIKFPDYVWKDIHGPFTRILVQWKLPGSGPILSAKPVLTHCREYLPEMSLNRLDTTNYHFQVNGNAIKNSLPPLAIFDVDGFQEDVIGLLHASQPAVEEWILNHWSAESLPRPIEPFHAVHRMLYHRTYQEAFRYRDQHQSRLLELAIRMHCYAIMSQGCGSDLGKKKRGVKGFDYSQSGRSEYEAYDRGLDWAIPQAAGHQFDVGILHYIGRKQTEFRNLLKLRMKPRKKSDMTKDIFELFLTFYVCLANLEYIHGSAERYITSKRNTVSIT